MASFCCFYCGVMLSPSCSSIFFTPASQQKGFCFATHLVLPRGIIIKLRGVIVVKFTCKARSAF